jgi:hypothetical protein
MHMPTHPMSTWRLWLGGAVLAEIFERRQIAGMVGLMAVAVFSRSVRGDIPYASSYITTGSQVREHDAQEKGLEARIEDLSARLKKARAAGEDVASMEPELAAAKAELDALVHLPKAVMPFHEHMVQRMDETNGLVPSRYDPEPISVEAAKQIRAMLHEDMGHPDINARWQEYLVSTEIDEAASHPDISRAAAKELRDALVEAYNGDRVYYNDSDVLLSVDFMGDLAAALYRVADPSDSEARQIADHLTERTLAWAETLQLEDDRTRYGALLGNLQEATQLMDEAVPEWLEPELQSVRDPEAIRKAKRVEEAVLKTKETARRDARNIERIKEVVAYGHADYGKAEWNASMLRMQLVFIRTVLSKSRKEVSDEVVKYLGKTLQDLALSGRISTRELWTLWAEAARALYRRAELLWEVKMNRAFAETDYTRPEVNRVAINELLRSYLAVLGKSPRVVPREVVAFIDGHLLEIVKEKPQTKLLSKEHWVLWGRAAGALGPDRASNEMKRFVSNMKDDEKDAVRRSAYQRVWRRIRDVSEEHRGVYQPTSEPTSTTTSRPAAAMLWRHP